MVLGSLESKGADRPKYVMAEESLLRAIRDGRLAPGQRLPGEVRLAEEMGIAYMTARHAVSRLVEQGHLERRRGVGTFVRRQTPGRNLALLVLNVSRIEVGHLPARELEIIQQAAQGVGRSVQAMLLLRPLPAPDEVMANLNALDVGAVGVVGFVNSDREFIQGLSVRIPCVLFNKTIPGVALPYCAPDMGVAARQMAEYFASRGRRRIGLVTLSPEHSLQAELAVALESEMHRLGLPIDKRLWFHEPDYADDHTAMRRWIEGMLARPDRADALIVPLREAAQAAQNAIERQGGRLGVMADLVTLFSGVDARRQADPWPLMALNYADAAVPAARHLVGLLAEDADTQAAPVWKSSPQLVMPEGMEKERSA